MRELRFILLFTGGVRYTCKPALDVHPDLTVKYCSSMREILPAFNIKDVSPLEIIRRHEVVSQKYKDYPWPHCTDCYYFTQKRCQGFCLRFKADLFKKKSEQKISGLREWINKRK